jgi:hypothetical protein
MMKCRMTLRTGLAADDQPKPLAALGAFSFHRLVLIRGSDLILGHCNPE